MSQRAELFGQVFKVGGEDAQDESGGRIRPRASIFQIAQRAALYIYVESRPDCRLAVRDRLERLFVGVPRRLQIRRVRVGVDDRAPQSAQVRRPLPRLDSGYFVIRQLAPDYALAFKQRPSYGTET